MKARLEIEEIPEGLLIRSVRVGSTVYALLSAALSAAVVFMFGRLYFHRASLAVLMVVAAAWASSRWWHAVATALRITTLEMLVTSDLKSLSRLNLRIPLANVLRLEYRASSGKDSGQDGMNSPAGLYAVQRWKADCVLPHLDEAQTRRAIEAICGKFPMIPMVSGPERDSFGRDLISLGLNASGNAAPGAGRGSSPL